MHAYCLFCQTQKCATVASLLRARGFDHAFAPQIVRRERRQGKLVETVRDLLPGYVFVYSEDALQDAGLFHGIDGIVRRLGQPENCYELTDTDRDFAMNLLARNGVVGAVRIVKIGDRVTLTDPLFNGHQGQVTKIDHRKQRARVDFTFDNAHCFTWLACEELECSERERGSGGVSSG